MATTITKFEFLKLEELVREKFEQECAEKAVDIPTESQKYYGYGEFNNGEHICLRHFISSYPKVKNYLQEINKDIQPENTGYKKINGKDFYDRMRKFRNNPALNDMSLDDIYEFVYFYYIDCDSIDDFRRKHLPEQTNLVFRQFYYSFRRNAVREAEIELTFGLSGIKARQKGFLDKRDDIELEGSGRLTRYSLKVSLESPEDDLMDIYIHINNKDPKDAQILLGLFVTQSAYHYPVSVETILVRKDLNLTQEDMLQIERFLFLKRHHFRAIDQEYTSFDQLRVKKQLVNAISFLAGKSYRVWAYTRSGQFIVQSKFVIEPNYKATVYATRKLYDRNEQVQTCILSISDVINPRLIVTMHPSEGSGIIGTSILEIPNRLRADLFTGVTCNVGLRNSPPSISHIALLQDDSEFEPDIFSPTEINKYIAGNEKLKELQKVLDKFRYETKDELTHKSF